MKGEGRVGGCEALGADGGRDGVGAPGPGAGADAVAEGAGEGGGVLVTGRLPAQPAS